MHHGHLHRPFVSLADACRLLLSGNVVAVPTETVYGLAAVATDAVAVEKIYTIKNRPADNPLICHFQRFDDALPYLDCFPDYVDVLQRCFSPGPISFLLPLKKNSKLEAAVRGQQNVIVRIPAHPLFLDLLACVKQPLAAPSANTSGRFSATTAQMVADDLGDNVDGILDGGPSENGIESTIVDCTNERVIKILRPGSIGQHDIVQALARFGVDVPVDYSQAAQPTPGTVYKHYAARTPLTKINALHELPDDEMICVLLTDEALVTATNELGSRLTKATLIGLGSENKPQTIARNLYAALAKLDAMKVQRAFLLYPKVTNPDWKRAIEYRLDKITGA